MYKKILLATDGHSSMERATAVIISFYKKWGSKIRIFHSIKHLEEKVTPPSHGLTAPYTSITYYNVISTAIPDGVLIEDKPNSNIIRLNDEEIEEIGESILNGTKVFFDEVKVPVQTRLIIKEDPEHYIERIVKKKNFDLVVIGYSGLHSKLKELVMGSVAKYVVANVSCDVLVIR